MTPKNFALQKLVAQRGNQNQTASPASPVLSRPAVQATPATPSPPRSLNHLLRRPSPPRPAPNPWIPRDDYTDIKELEHGTEARTSLTKSTKTGKVYVVKRYTKYPVFVANPSLRLGEQQLPNEAQVLLAALRPHPNILRAFGCDLFGAKKASLYSEYCSGGDLTDYVIAIGTSKRSAPESLALHVFISLAQALCYLHHGLRWDSEDKRYWQEPSHVSYVHGDVKCENVFLRWTSEAERLGLPDIVLGDLGATQPENTFNGIPGTRGYQAPECARIWALEKSDPNAFHVKRRAAGRLMTTATDVFSLGQVIHLVGTSKLHAVGGDPMTEPVIQTRVGVVGVKLGKEPRYETQALIKAVKGCLQSDRASRPVAKEGSLLDDVALCREALKKMLAKKEADSRV